ncbi:MAG: hypothetical protein JNJ92_06600 [Altererythrobacter sp.]|nr:hypothetical protein [Altererythrobacter sp.]
MPIGRELFAQRAFVRLFRLWAVSRAQGLDELAAMGELVPRLLLPAETVPAAAGFFSLVEGRLGRPLAAESCCSRRLSPDEEALLRLVLLAPEAGGTLTSTAVPHGLPSALCWTALAVRNAFGLGDGGNAGTTGPLVCPFEPASAPQANAHGF